MLLDEASALLLALQTKLFRALEARAALPVGATVPVPTDARILATADRNVAAGRFRAELSYRLAVLPLAATALAERGCEVVPVAAALWLRRDIAASLISAAQTKLATHGWPGNVCELSNVTARAGGLADDATIDAHDVRFYSVAPTMADAVV